MDAANKTLAIYFPDLAGGGIERLCLNLAPAFKNAGYDVTFVLQSATGELINSVPSGVKVVSLGTSRTLFSLVPLVRYLQKNQPDILFTGHGHNNILALWAHFFSGTRTRVIVSVHNAVSIKKLGVNSINYRLLPLLERLFFDMAEGIVAVSKGVADDLAKVTRLPLDRITTIYNPIVSDDFDTRMSEPINHPWLNSEDQTPVILGAGRFVEQKDFAVLIEAFAKIVRRKDARLILLGDGPLRENLKELAQNLGVIDKIDMPGFQQNPLPWMKRATLLAMSSRYEGFGNVLVEAIACGTPVVSTDCTFGPWEILDGGKFGHLTPVGDADAMANAILTTIENRLSTDILRARGKEFTVASAAEQYIALFNQVIQS